MAAVCGETPLIVVVMATSFTFMCLKIKNEHVPTGMKHSHVPNAISTIDVRNEHFDHMGLREHAHELPFMILHGKPVFREVGLLELMKPKVTCAVLHQPSALPHALSCRFLESPRNDSALKQLWAGRVSMNANQE